MSERLPKTFNPYTISRLGRLALEIKCLFKLGSCPQWDGGECNCGCDELDQIDLIKREQSMRENN